MLQADAVLGLIAELYATSALKDARIRELESQIDSMTPSAAE